MIFNNNHIIKGMKKTNLLMILLMCTAYNSLIIAAKPLLKATTGAISCYGRTDGKLKLEFEKISIPAQVNILSDLKKDTITITLTKDTTIIINNLPAGDYLIELTINNKIISKKNQTITQPEKLNGNKIILVKAPSSETACDGILRANPSGGTPPYTYLWSKNTNSATNIEVPGICMGVYRCDINDSNQCGPVYPAIPVYQATMNNYLQDTKVKH
jgi:hypothetical protein